MLIQLKPYEESFYNILFRKLGKLDFLILCEGKTEAEIFKALFKELRMSIPGEIGVTDAEGIDTLYELSRVMLNLTKIFRKVKKLDVLVDAENMGIEERVKSLVNSLRSLGCKVTDLIKVCSHTFKLTVTNVTVIITVSGVESFKQFQKHTIEDHALKLLLKVNPNVKGKVESIKEAKEIIRREKILELIEKTEGKYVEEAFNHIKCLIKQLNE